MPIHWHQWGNGVDKKGFMESHMILCTFAYHLSRLETISRAYERLEARPIGALLMSAQAVQHELGFWKTGEYVKPGKRPNYFSEDNYGVTIEQLGGGRKKRIRRATKFLSAGSQWDTDKWDALIAAAQPYVEKPKRARTASCTSSEAGDAIEIISDDEEIVVLSD
ncbi:hypothetical protein R3P38DRAFT_2745993 [Favolaschia claudopus]|uniref:Uncharacterized protein n=1 Tax=Favolaschia claudopus TaxID=2862362 RepID=A0AAV9ZFU4_9AGAR